MTVPDLYRALSAGGSRQVAREAGDRSFVRMMANASSVPLIVKVGR